MAALFGSFSLFWTVVPLYLSQHFHLTQKEITLFGFAGVAGAVGSALGGWSYAHGNWAAASMFGFSLPVVAFVYFLTEENSPAFRED